MWTYLARLILRRRNWNLGVILILTIFMAYKARQIGLSYEMTQMLPASDTTRVYYEKFKQIFGEDGSVIFIGIDDENIKNLDEFNDWYDLTSEIQNISGVEGVLSVTRLFNLIKNDSLYRFDIKPVIQRKPRTQAELDSLLNIAYGLPFYEGLLYNKETNFTMMAGDKIIKINGEDAFGKKINNEYVMKLLRGKKGTSVDVSILRSGKDELIDFTIVRDKIPINSIDATYMAAPEIGYIKLTRFAKSSVQEFNESLSRLRAQGMKDLILDLRGNTGGYLNIAVDLADQFLSDKKMIVYTEGLRSPKQEFFSTGSGDFLRGKLIVLINESSASASEIVSGAVQDWDRGLVVGRRSFGKGLVQRPFNLPDGAMIRLTTARYYTPSGRCIQKPYEHGETEEYYKDLTKRLESGELVDSNSIELADSLKYFTSNGRVVYGGGGIIPDIFTPIDSTRFSDFYSDLVRKGIFNTYNLNYLEKNRKRVLKEYPNVESFKEKFIVTDEMYADFLDLAKEKNVERKETEKYYYPDNDLKIQIKALIARNLWDTNAYFRLINELDDELNVAVDLMQSGKAFTDLKLH
jgi:carboxyl-terminal processing protease